MADTLCRQAIGLAGNIHGVYIRGIRQKTLEEIVLALVKHYLGASIAKTKRLCYAGGVALNVAAADAGAAFDAMLRSSLCLPSGLPAPEMPGQAPDAEELTHCPLCRLSDAADAPPPAPVVLATPAWTAPAAPRGRGQAPRGLRRGQAPRGLRRGQQ